MTRIIPVKFNAGIQFPPQLGTLILRKTAESKLAYAQNVDSIPDEYGSGVVTPGPSLGLIGNNSQLDGSPIGKAFVGQTFVGIGYLYFIQGVLGATAKIRRIKDLISGLTPVIDTTGSMTANHGPAHANQKLVDIVLRPDSGGNLYVYVSGKDDTDTWVYKFDGASATPSLSLIVANSNFTGGFTDQFLVLGSDNNLYWIGGRRVSSINTSDTYAVNALVNGLPLGVYAIAGVDWNQQLAIAYTNDASGGFDRRLSAGGAGIILWDYISSNFSKNIPAPSRFISALKVDQSGNMICFGGIDEGKSTIYGFTGYGFTPLYTYIGDLPRSQHSVEFDGQGRILFQTADGQFCRYDRTNGIFDHLGTMPTASSAGGLLAKGIGSPKGEDLIMGSASGTDYYMKIASFGTYTGDGAGADNVNTPRAVAGIIQTPYNSTISAITVHLTRPLASGEKVILEIYVNGSNTPRTYLALDFAIDGAVTSRRKMLTIPKVNNFSLGLAWKMTDGNTTAPAVLPADVEIE